MALSAAASWRERASSMASAAWSARRRSTSICSAANACGSGLSMFSAPMARSSSAAGFADQKRDDELAAHGAGRAARRLVHPAQLGRHLGEVGDEDGRAAEHALAADAVGDGEGHAHVAQVPFVGGANPDAITLAEEQPADIKRGHFVGAAEHFGEECVEVKIGPQGIANQVAGGANEGVEFGIVARGHVWSILHPVVYYSPWTNWYFGLASSDDRARILEIAAQTWEGDDYIPDVIDEWLSSGRRGLIVAELDGRVVGLARYDRTFPAYAWFEGLRVDPAYRGRGIAKAMTGHLVELAQADRVTRIGLSTYFDNDGSQKVSAAFGFEKAAGFAACSAEAEKIRGLAGVCERAESVPLDEAVRFVASSDALAAGEGFLPHSWRFYPFARGPEIALGRMAHRIGIREGGRLAALLCIGDHTPHGPSSFSLDFLEGKPELLDELVRHALTLISGERYIEAMVPCRDGVALPTMAVLQAAGFEPWNGGREDVLVFERGELVQEDSETRVSARNLVSPSYSQTLNVLISNGLMSKITSWPS